MQRKGARFGELYVLRGVGVLVEDVAACYGALGVVLAVTALDLIAAVRMTAVKRNCA